MNGWKILWIAFMLLGVLSILSQDERRVAPLPSSGVVALASLDPVSMEELEPAEKRCLVGGRLYDHYISAFADPGFIIYDLGGKYSRLEGFIGVTDEYADLGIKEAKYSISIDGKEITSGTYSQGKPPVRIQVRIPRGGRTLKIQLENFLSLVNAQLFVADPTVPEPVSPVNRETIKADSVVLKWDPVPHATAYGVEIVLARLTGTPKPVSTRIWCATVPVTSHQFELKDVPNGEYQWSVIAFNPTERLGRFSRAGSFIVAR